MGCDATMFSITWFLSQPQHSSRQRREEIINEGRDDVDIQGYLNLDGTNMPQTHVLETQENEKVYCVNVDDDTHPSNECTHDTCWVSGGRGEQQSRLSSHSNVRRESSSHRSGRN